MRWFRVSVGIAVAIVFTVVSRWLHRRPHQLSISLTSRGCRSRRCPELQPTDGGACTTARVITSRSRPDWNGELVLYAHGYRGTGPELTVDNPSIRAYLVNNGFAWAASSYSTNGYDVKQGVKDTHALGALFQGLVGNPEPDVSHRPSMGGHITGVAIEQYPNAYAGAMPMCGVMGDNTLFDYFLDYHLIAQALADWPAQFPAPADYLTSVVPAVKTALASSFPAGLNSDGEKLKAVTELLTGGDRPTF